MRRLLSFLLFISACAQAQVTPTPDILWGQLFRDVQTSRALGDNKTFVDMVPKYSPAVIMDQYNRLQYKDSASLRTFVLSHFYLPPTPVVDVPKGLALRNHLHQLWNTLSRKADSVHKWSSLLPLPFPYVVPGGRFREIYYWDSYFTMQGLAVSNRFDLIESMIKNFAFIINRYGHIPNGNRNYYLSRSQPPYFASMVQLLRNYKGDAVYRTYFSAMEKEYNFWMNGKNNLRNRAAYRRVVKMPDGSILNRYWDDNNIPRQESYAEDVHTARRYTKTDGLAYRNLRAGAESGWDFSSRWLADTLHLHTIETTHIVPVDLNALLYEYEMILAKAARALRNTAKETMYLHLADSRRAAILKYCWSEPHQFFFDYDFQQRHTTNRWSLAGVMPMFVSLATEAQVRQMIPVIRNRFLKEGGVVSTSYHTGQQWDAPNGWPPLQFITVQGLMNYGATDLATVIADRWMNINERVFQSTGKMMEKYNVENISLESGGGEYPTQDGFGWTNGVYLKFFEMFRDSKKLNRAKNRL